MSKPENKIEDKDLIPIGPPEAQRAGYTQGTPGLGIAGTPSGSLCPISHKDFNEFVKGKGFVGRNNYKLRELKAMFGFKPLTHKNQTTVNIDDGKQFRSFESISKASIGSGIPYTMLIHARKKSKLNTNSDDPVTIRSGGNIYVIKFTPI